MFVYEKYDREIASKVKVSMKQHFWYLTEPLDVLSLFDNSVSVEEKGAISTAITAIHPPANINPGKLMFPSIRQLRSSLSGICPKSYLMFTLLGMDHGWLTLPQNAWQHDNRYMEMHKVVSTLNVANDIAERCVKNVQDFKNAARDGAYRHEIILTANDNRCKIPSFAKMNLKKICSVVLYKSIAQCLCHIHR